MIIPVNHRLPPIIKGKTYAPEALVIYVDGIVKDLTGYVVQLIIHDGDTLVATLTDGAGLLVDAEQGIIAPMLTIAETLATYTAGEFSYYLELKEPDGAFYHYAEGQLTVQERGTINVNLSEGIEVKSVGKIPLPVLIKWATNKDRAVASAAAEVIDAYDYIMFDKVYGLLKTTINGVEDWLPAFNQLVSDNPAKTVLFQGHNYNVSRPIVIYSMNTNKILWLGQPGTTFTLTSTVATDCVIKLKCRDYYANRYKRFENIQFIAYNTPGQSCIKTELYNPNTNIPGVECPFEFKSCYFKSMGYNIYYGDCNWNGNSFLKECEGTGGGLIYVKLASSAYAGRPYPHAFSNLVIEDYHFIAIGGLPTNSLMYLEGCQNTYIKNVTIEGEANYFKSDIASTFTKGTYVYINSGTVTFDTFWCESGGTNNTTNAYSLFVTAQGASTMPTSVVFENCAGPPLRKTKLDRVDASSSYPVVEIRDSFFYYILPILDISAGFVHFVNCSLNDRFYTYARHKRIRFTNCHYCAPDSATTIGSGVINLQTDRVKQTVVYRYTGGWPSNEMAIVEEYSDSVSYKMHFPHRNNNDGCTILLKTRPGFKFNLKTVGLSTIPFSNAIVAGQKLTVYFLYRAHHHSTNRVKPMWTPYIYAYTLYDSVSFDILAELASHDIFGTGTAYAWLELSPFVVTTFEPEPIYPVWNAKCIGMKYRPNEDGTWDVGDEIKSRDVTTTEKKICTKAGTSRTISATGNVKTGETNKLYIPTWSEFTQFVGGEYLNVAGVSCRVLDYFYGSTDADNYLLLDKNLIVGTDLAVVNNNPIFRVI